MRETESIPTAGSGSAQALAVPDDFPRFVVPGYEPPMDSLRRLFWLHYEPAGMGRHDHVLALSVKGKTIYVTDHTPAGRRVEIMTPAGFSNSLSVGSEAK